MTTPDGRMNRQQVVEALRWAEYQAMVQRMHGSSEAAKREELFRTLADRIQDGEEEMRGFAGDCPSTCSRILIIDWSDE